MPCHDALALFGQLCIRSLTFENNDVCSAPFFAIAINMTAPPPADSPEIVTLFASPPNLPICFCAHSSAKLTSSIPALTTPFALTSLEDKKPNAPSYVSVSVSHRLLLFLDIPYIV